MNNYVYSPSANAFFSVGLQSLYEGSGTWPDDGIDVDDAVFGEFTAVQPVGKVRTAGDGGLPA